VSQIEKIIRSVIDPETLNSIYDLGFIREVKEENNKVMITLTPPTFWCPPTFLYMILEDLRDKLRRNYSEVYIEIIGHHDGERLSKCINNGLKFEECYRGEIIKGEYEELKRRFKERFERGKSNYLVKLSLEVTGEICKLLAEERRWREGG
jgi:metal-sulfur cluster biosynthetic enzyme